MTRLLTSNIATMIEMRQPQKVLDRANGQPVAIISNSVVVGYLIPVAYVKNNGQPFQSMDDVIQAMKDRAGDGWPIPKDPS